MLAPNIYFAHSFSTYIGHAIQSRQVRVLGENKTTNAALIPLRLRSRLRRYSLPENMLWLYRHFYCLCHACAFVTFATIFQINFERRKIEHERRNAQAKTITAIVLIFPQKAIQRIEPNVILLWSLFSCSIIKIPFNGFSSFHSFQNFTDFYMKRYSYRQQQQFEEQNKRHMLIYMLCYK